ncbi:DUF1194 domain-containing protein [Hoeflea sp. G2-23]|uniref:DUF1194 domain-containing protein n=1 Tax=Hoeflea algicola TaxID=2983763 RepID=A0ABT3Z7R3_9HYPH|nr:DUF1194 domain-containing protein [Hoeflea algicola]MCY0147764.1 DUF1194 domain-containing protein [Hoeflea algicola]
MAGWLKCLMVMAGLLPATSVVRAQEPVDVALVLAIDVSRSMSPEELAIQRDGYAAALKHPDVVRAIAQGAYGRIAITMFEWAGDTSIRDVFDWTLVKSRQDADRVADVISRSRPVGQRRTSISGALAHAVARFDAAPFESLRKVIDVSGDGPNNQGGPVLAARAAALERQVVINGLPLMTDSGAGRGFNIDDLDRYYAQCVIGGPGSFLVPVTDWQQFPETIRRKLILEIGGNVPREEPTVLPTAASAPQRSNNPIETYDCLIGEKIWEQRQWVFDDR